MTLLELLIATSIMAIMAAVLGALALTVQMQSAHSQGQGEAVQHARVVLDRLQRMLNEATANEQFPGFIVQAVRAGSYDFPDVLVIWHPTGAAADSAGLPRWNELVVICPDAARPNVLLEITSPGDTRIVPPVTNTAAWSAELNALRASNATDVVELTNLLRTATISGDSSSLAQTRAAVRFDLRKRPDDAQWAEYQGGTRAWADIDWVQGLYGTRTGLRQVWCRIELQLVPGSSAETDSGQNTLTFFGSGAIYHELHK
jgi:type II secretory pathway pseudopilin PulG